MRSLFCSLALALFFAPFGAQAQSGLGFQTNTVPPAQAPQGFERLDEIAPNLPYAGQVRVAWSLIRIVPTTRSGRHTHAISASYYLSPNDCELARQVLFEESQSSLCLPVAIPY